MITPERSRELLAPLSKLIAESPLKILRVKVPAAEYDAVTAELHGPYARETFTYFFSDVEARPMKLAVVEVVRK